MDILNQIKTRLDGFINAVTSVGTSRDPGTQNQYSRAGRLNRTFIDGVYAESSVFAKIIDLYPQTALSKWVTYNHDMAQEIEAKVEELNLKTMLSKAGIKDRKDGGAVLYPDVDDGQEHDTPLNIDNIRAFNTIRVIEGRYVQPMNAKRDGKPRDGLYTLTNETGGQVVIHESRLLIFDGIEVSDDFTSYNEGICGNSISLRIKNSVANYEMAVNNNASLSAKILIGVWSIEGLNEMIQTSEDSDADLKARFKAKTLGVSHINDVVIDGQDKYSMLAPNMTGIKEVISNAERDLVAVSGIPHTKLLGESSGGLGSTGKSERDDWQETIGTYQTEKYISHIKQLYLFITQALGFEPVEDLEFPPVYQQSEKEQAETMRLVAEAHSKYLNDNVFTEQEIRDTLKGEFTTKVMQNDAEYNSSLNVDLIDESNQT